MKAALARISVSARQNDDSRRSRGPLGFPLLEGEGQGEVCDLFGESTHLSPTLSFREREPVAQIGESRRWRGTVQILALCLAAGVAALSLPALREQLDDFLTQTQMQALLKRRDLLVSRLESLGTGAVFTLGAR